MMNSNDHIIPSSKAAIRNCVKENICSLRKKLDETHVHTKSTALLLRVTQPLLGTRMLRRMAPRRFPASRIWTNNRKCSRHGLMIAAYLPEIRLDDSVLLIGFMLCVYLPGYRFSTTPSLTMDLITSNILKISA